jgi:hypothetical protein
MPDEILPPAPLPTVAPVAYAPPPVQHAAPTDLQSYASRVKIVGFCFVALAVLYLASLLFFASAAGTAGLAGSMQNPPPGSRAAEQTPAERTGILVLFAAIVNVTRIAGLVCAAIAAFGLLGKHAWGRIATIVVSIPMLLLFPFGTVVAIYALYLMMKSGSRENWALLSARA